MEELLRIVQEGDLLGAREILKGLNPEELQELHRVLSLLDDEACRTYAEHPDTKGQLKTYSGRHRGAKR